MGPITDECLEASAAPWAARAGARAAERLRLFRDFVPEHLIFRGHPALPFVLVTPVVGFCFERYAERPAHGLLGSALLFALGVLGWTLVEYLMHRFLFHVRVRGPRAKVIAFVVHGHHHVTPREPSRLAATPVQIVSLALLLGGLWQLAVGPLRLPIVMAGTLAGYLAYEAIHHLAHHDQPKSPVLRAIVQHHRRHHDRGEGRWGISSPLWDWVFRTHR